MSLLFLTQLTDLSQQGIKSLLFLFCPNAHDGIHRATERPREASLKASEGPKAKRKTRLEHSSGPRGGR